jgi:hypothetical protein
VQRPPRKTGRHSSPPPADILERALAQLDQAGEILFRLRKALDGFSRAERGEGRSHRVCFMNRFARGSNAMTACQRTIVIPSAASREAAIEAAKRRFAELEGICDWHIHASFMEVGLLEEDAVAGCETDEQPSAVAPPSECGTRHEADRKIR